MTEPPGAGGGATRGPGGQAARDAVEHEVKLEVDAAFVMPDLTDAAPGLAAESLDDQQLDAVYYDEPTGTLLDAGITVRRRTGEGTRWTVKVPAAAAVTGAAVARRELEVVTDDVAVPEAVAALVTERVGPVALEAVAHLRSLRRRWRLTGAEGAAVGEVADDAVVAAVPGETATVAFREIEVEFDPAVEAGAIEAVVAVLVGAGARAGDPRSKLERSLALLGRR